ncbi:hypothetical protein RQP46_008066 [Phenoliferia psychrophenolica]
MLLLRFPGLPNATQLEQSNELKLDLLTIALSELENLRELRLDVKRILPDSLLKLLLPLTGLTSLSLDLVRCESNKTFDPDLLNQLSMPHLRTLETGRLRHSEEHDIIINTLASGSTAGIQSLHIGGTSYRNFYKCLPSLLPFTSTLVDFSWSPDRQPLTTTDRDAVLALLGSMTSLQSLTLNLWTIGDPEMFFMKLYGEVDMAFGTDEPIDTTLFDSLATLPSLHTVDLKAYLGILDHEPVRKYLAKAPALRTLILTTRVSNVWTLAQWMRVRDAGEKARVVFAYKINAQEMMWYNLLGLKCWRAGFIRLVLARERVPLHNGVGSDDSASASFLGISEVGYNVFSVIRNWGSILSEQSLELRNQEGRHRRHRPPQRTLKAEFRTMGQE